MERAGTDLKRLLTDHLDLIFSYSLFIAGRRDRALDLMQDTITSLLSKKRAVYEEREAFRAWIFRVLKNNWINRVSRDSVLREIAESDIRSDDEMPLEHADTAADPAETADPILRERLLTAFSRLPADQQEVCYCVDVEGLSYDETARRLAIPIGTVMSRLHRGRETLKTQLRREAAELHIVPFPEEARHERRKVM